MFNEYYEEVKTFEDFYVDKKFYYGEPTESFTNNDYNFMKTQLEKGNFVKL